LAAAGFALKIERPEALERDDEYRISMLAAPPLWLLIVLMAPFDAYVAARSIANED